MKKKSIEIVIDKTGNFALEAKEGFAGENCLSQTKDIEIVLGGIEIDDGKTNAFYDGDDSPVSINLDL